MGQSARVRAGDARAIFRLIGECRELGEDRTSWRQHLIAGLARAVDADVGLSGEMAGCRTFRNIDLGVTFWWPAGFPRPGFLDTHMDNFRREPHYSPAMVAYQHHLRRDPGVCLTRKDFIDDRLWYDSHDFNNIQAPLGLDSTLWCYHPITTTRADESAAIILTRTRGRGDFRPRDRAIVREAQALITPLVGGPLARFADPSPLDLAPRAREVLACLLEGDADKQVAARLGLTRHTVNQYTKGIFRHFGVTSRPALLARWIKRRWAGPESWRAREPREANIERDRRTWIPGPRS